MKVDILLKIKKYQMIKKNADEGAKLKHPTRPKTNPWLRTTV